jgi:hypothetical protein
MAFSRKMSLDKLKKLISFKETDPDKEEQENREMSKHLRDTNVCCSPVIYRNRP